MIDLKAEEKNKKQILIICGLSGAGKTVCFQVLSDFGYTILSGVNEENYEEIISRLIAKSSNHKIALILNIVNEKSFTTKYKYLKGIKKNFVDYEFKQIFLKAKEEVLLNRYNESRKIHPYSYYNGRNIPLLDGIRAEKEITLEFSRSSDLTIDTSALVIAETKKILEVYLSEEEIFTINITSFGFKYGIDPNSDFIFDLRSLPNPFYVPELRKQTGKNPEVAAYVFSTPEANALYDSVKTLITTTIPGYKKVGKAYIHVAFGCTGGQHRSVAFAERLSKDLSKECKVSTSHSEGERKNWKL